MESHCLGEKMDLIDLEEETIDAEILDSMAVSQETSRQHKSQCLFFRKLFFFESLWQRVFHAIEAMLAWLGRGTSALQNHF